MGIMPLSIYRYRTGIEKHKQIGRQGMMHRTCAGKGSNKCLGWWRVAKHRRRLGHLRTEERVSQPFAPRPSFIMWFTQNLMCAGGVPIVISSFLVSRHSLRSRDRYIHRVANALQHRRNTVQHFHYTTHVPLTWRAPVAWSDL